MLGRKKKADPVFDAIKAMQVFSRLPDKEVAALAKAGREVEHPAGGVIMKQGDRGVGFHIILEGSVDVFVGESTVATLSAGDYFGEIGLIDEQPRTATVVAATDLKALVIMSWAFRPMLDKHPALARTLLENMSKRIRENNG